MDATILLGVELMLFGLIGVFTTLIVFILLIKGLTKAFPVKPEPEEEQH